LMIVYSSELFSATGTQIIPSQCRNLGVFIDLTQKKQFEQRCNLLRPGGGCSLMRSISLRANQSLIWFTSTCAAGLIIYIIQLDRTHFFDSILHLFHGRLHLPAGKKKFPCTRRTRTAKIVPRRH
jgi:hypothetical protein